MTTVPPTLAALQREVDAALAPELEALRSRLVALDDGLAGLADALVDLASDGKRLRPVLLLLGHDLAGGRDHADVLGPALALELVHTCALLHDDVIDRSPSRRGRPTLHERFAALHREREDAVGDADAFGRALAILAGDLVLVLADDRFRAARVPSPALALAWERFTELRVEVMAGQVLDVDAAATRRVDRERALRIATLKSGRYSIARPLEIGALLAGAPPSLADALRRVGDPLGRAFQLRDDLLGVFGDEGRTGKSTSSDLAEGKRTLLVVEALERLDADDRRALEAGLGDPTLDAARTARLAELIVGSGARDAVERCIAADLAAAEDALAALDVPATPAETLRELARYLVRRQH